MTFTELGLDARLIRSLEAEGYVQPTPIQAQAIPSVMRGADLLGIAQTGTGKTAAFALPILHRIAAERRPAPRRGCRVLVLSPTRELASQIADSFRTYGRHMGVSVAVVFGGVGHRPQIAAMARGVDILVATPGRLIDHTQSGHIVLEGTEIFVLDEADQMLDLGFLQPIRKIVALLKGRRQNLFFSATMPGEIGKLAGELLRNPEKVSVAPAATTAERVSQRVIHVDRHKKRAVLVELLGHADMKRALVFTRTKRGADKVADHLEAANISVAAIHGNKSQGQRERALSQFRRSEIRVLVATDIAARGIDIDQVSHVINFELPDVPEAYVHRIGRTARAGETGVAISLCDPEERGQLRDIERLTRQQIPHENRRTGDDEPLDAVGAPRERPQGQQGRRSGQQQRPYGAGRGGDGGKRSAPHAGSDRRHARQDGPGERGAQHRAGDRPAGARPASERPAGDRHDGERRSGDRHNGERPTGARHNGERPSRDRHNGDRYNDDRHTSARYNGERSSGDRHNGDLSAPRHAASRHAGERPAGARHNGDRPNAQRGGPRHGATQRTGDRPAGGRDHTARPAGREAQSGHRHGGGEQRQRRRPASD